MLNNRTIYSNLGNHVAEYVESHFVCDDCKGTGSVVVDRKDLIDRMEGLTFGKAIYMYRQWKIYGGRCDCPSCDGFGSFTDRS